MSTIDATVYFRDYDDDTYKSKPVTLCGIPPLGSHIRSGRYLWQVKALQFNHTGGPNPLSIRAESVTVDLEVSTQFQREAEAASSSQEPLSRGFEQGPGPL